VSFLGRGELAQAQARMAALELVFEVEQTMKWLDSMGPHLDPPTPEDVARLEDVVEQRRQQVDASTVNLLSAVHNALDLEIVVQRRRLDL
jgi:hypothetical protein